MKLTAALVIAVAVYKFRCWNLFKRPDAVLSPRIGACCAHMVKGVISRLQLRRNISSVDFGTVEFHTSILNNNALIGIGIKAFTPEHQAKIPFCSIKLGTVKFVRPNELPLAILGKITRYVILYFVFFHFFISLKIEFCFSGANVGQCPRVMA